MACPKCGYENPAADSKADMPAVGGKPKPPAKPKPDAKFVAADKALTAKIAQIRKGSK